MDSGIDSTESSNGSISEPSFAKRYLLDEAASPPHSFLTMEAVNQTTELLKCSSKVSNFSFKSPFVENVCNINMDGSDNKTSSFTFKESNINIINKLNNDEMNSVKNNEVKINNDSKVLSDKFLKKNDLKMLNNYEEYENLCSIPRTVSPQPPSQEFTKPEIFFPEGVCLKLDNVVPPESPLTLQPLHTLTNSKFIRACSQPYTGSLAVLPYESRALQRKFRHYRKKLRQIVTNKHNDKSLRLAAMMNNEDLLKQLLQKGTDVNGTDERERTALHIAASKGYSNIVKLLLESGADPNVRDSIGNTPLHLAACTAHISTVTLLLKAGTNVSQADNQGFSPLDLAHSRLKLLQNRSDHSSTYLRSHVFQIVEMIGEYLESSGMKEEAEMLTALTSKLSLTEGVETSKGEARAPSEGSNEADLCQMKVLMNSLQDLTLREGAKRQQQQNKQLSIVEIDKSLSNK